MSDEHFTSQPTFWDKIFGRHGISRKKSKDESGGEMVWIPVSDHSSARHHDCDDSNCNAETGADCTGGDGAGGGGGGGGGGGDGGGGGGGD